MAFMAAELALLRAEKVERDAELARCHERIRRLESLTKAPPQGVNLMASGSVILDSFVQFHVVPWPKDNRPAFKDLRLAPRFPRRMVRDEVTNRLRLETDREQINKHIDERTWVGMIARIRGTCRLASQFEVPGMQEYLLATRLRMVAVSLHDELDKPRGQLLDNWRFPYGYGINDLLPRRIIGETFLNLPYQGLREALELVEDYEVSGDESE